MQSYITEHYRSDRMDVPEKLKQSREAAKGVPMRSIKCPKCGFYLLDAFGYGHYLIRIKCRKCKFDEVIDTALFRTMRPRRQQRFRAERRRRYGQNLYLY